jgi:hypothetical protein
LLRWGIASAVVLALVLTVGLAVLARQDAKHALFYNSGKTINGFLGTYCEGITQAIESGNPAAMTRFYAAGFSPSGRALSNWREPVGVGAIEVAHIDNDAAGAAEAGAADVAAYYGDYVRDFGTIEASICKIDLIETMEPGRTAALTVKVHLGGVDPAGRRFEDRKTRRWQLVNQASIGGAADAAPEVDWRIVDDRSVDGVRVSGDGRRFEGVDPADIGIDFTHQRDPKLHMKKFARDLKFGVIQHASGGVSAADYDGDGWEDLLFADGRRARLYRHTGLDRDGRPRFRDVTDEAGLGTIDSVNSGLFADIDNDGDQDLFLARYLAPSRLFLNNGDGTLTDASAETHLDFVAPLQPRRIPRPVRRLHRQRVRGPAATALLRHQRRREHALQERRRQEVRRRHPRSRRRRHRLDAGRRRGRLRRRRLARPGRGQRFRPQDAVQEQRRRHLHRRGQGRRRAGLQRRHGTGLRRLRRRRADRPLHVQHQFQPALVR